MIAPSRLSRPSHRAGLVAIVVATVALLGACSSSSTSDGSSATTAPDASTTTAAAAPTTTVTVPADRAVDIQEPDGYQKGTPTPLLVMLHGYGANGAAEDAYLKLGKAAAAKGLLYVAPDGTENRAGKRFWNATDACCAGPTPKIDDSAYLDAVIAQATATYSVDPKRIYVLGHSNGGFMSYRMACDHADEIAAIVSIEGATFDDPSDCRPSEPVSALEIHGTADHTIPYGGARIAGRPFPGAKQTVKTWATYDGCDLSTATPEPQIPTLVKDLGPATVTTYESGCKAGTTVELWTQPDGVHIPPWTDGFAERMITFLLAHPKR